ncbi:hypothetical protein [Hymenobacter weizhouensis]|uniref:hypothetical protein n=1 Tax=Hymenobacter sp. YIM 151500-1 TaxID=2987689 RepID=UPI002227C935|nr:hypothetical protein [Hymenobacter sp. YIM 151500-1]UYZ64772.1 hypothetical protein OIS53_07965 [Hymenobacter sp. YIM 151500-1]
MLYIPIPRRSRRRLLFPPGLLALAWLLWLGCAALPQMRGMERTYVLQIRIPNSSICNLFTNNPLITREGIDPFCYSQKRLDSLFKLNGYNLFLSGNLWQDYYHYRLASNLAVQPTNRDIYIRLHFPQITTYSHFVQFFDQLTVNDLNHYWCDMRQDSILLHIVNLRRYHVRNTNAFLDTTRLAPILGCGTAVDIEGGRQPRIVLTLEKTLSTLILSPDWRNSTLLLLLMGLLSLRQLRRHGL